ncbi:hypothetical protein [Paenibacillus sp. NEAU-GSW1]|uniref:hypothetical protein n=1 Tax=Paenibacillus sp. NEAU-GSW1 TaxID=2682486 RepID=UPI0012E29A7D|nr:hypothetical protein [Paenibacillus sp. NEAU-GSW1]MUT66737.1 hypothetical protein [Paenibacillus sp. NEAU-GSW1]
MNKIGKTRDLIYVSKEDHTNCFYSYGIEFHEFMSCIPDRPDNLLLIKHNFEEALMNRHTGFEYVTKQEINKLIEDDVYGYGDFCWVDFIDEEELDALSSDQIAQLLFFGHLARPLHKIPMNRFAYFAHDDGWFNKLYITEHQDYENLLANVIPMKLRRLTGRKVNGIPSAIASKLVTCAKDGLFIDLSNVIKSRTQLKIPMTAIGHWTDMDQVYNLREEINHYQIWLLYSNKVWRIVKED